MAWHQSSTLSRRSRTRHLNAARTPNDPSHRVSHFSTNARDILRLPRGAALTSPVIGAPRKSRRKPKVTLTGPVEVTVVRSDNGNGYGTTFGAADVKQNETETYKAVFKAP